MAPARPSIAAHDAFGHRIRSVRKALSLTQVDFARRLGCAQGHLSEIESGKYAPSVFFLASIALAFPMIDLRWLILGEGSMMFAAPSAAGSPMWWRGQPAVGKPAYGINAGINQAPKRRRKRA